MKITIPSLSRSSKVGKTVDLVGKKNVCVYIHKRELDDYTKHLSKSIIKVMPDDLFGVGAVRKFMLEDNRQSQKDSYIFQLDDDVTYMKYKFADKTKHVAEPDHVLAVIDNVARMADEIETPLFGFMAQQNPRYGNQLSAFQFNGMVSMGLGILYKHLGSINFDPRLVLKNDLDFWLQTKYYKRYVLLDTRYCLVYGLTWTAQGGCSVNRNDETLAKTKQILIDKYGSNVIQTRPEKPNQLSIRVGF